MKNKKGPYTGKLRPDDDVYTVQDFKEAVKSGAFIDYDGMGYPVKNGKSNPGFTVQPSKVEEIPADATHVVWFNR